MSFSEQEIADLCLPVHRQVRPAHVESRASDASAIALSVALLLALFAVAGGKQREIAADRATPAANTAFVFGRLPAGREAAGEARAKVKGGHQPELHRLPRGRRQCADRSDLPEAGGQYGDYLAHALQAYRAGDRQHALMTPQAKDLSDQDIADLAAYFGSRPSQLRDLHGVK